MRLTIPWKHNVQIEYLALSVSEHEIHFNTKQLVNEIKQCIIGNQLPLLTRHMNRSWH